MDHEPQYNRPLSDEQRLYISKWLEEKSIPPSASLLTAMDRFHGLVTCWSQRMNLVSKNDLKSLVEHHMVDSLTPVELLPKSCELLDIGSGAGFPGIMLALVRADIAVTLVESRRKKALFLRKAKEELGLENVSIFEGRLENMTMSPRFDMATIRAVPRWQRLMPQLKRLLKPTGRIVYYERRGKCRLIVP